MRCAKHAFKLHPLSVVTTVVWNWRWVAGCHSVPVDGDGVAASAAAQEEEVN